MSKNNHWKREEYIYLVSAQTFELMEDWARYGCIEENSHNKENIVDILTKEILQRKKSIGYCRYKEYLQNDLFSIKISSILDDRCAVAVWALILEFAEYHLEEQTQVQAEGGLGFE